jgi:hypothetical protein
MHLITPPVLSNEYIPRYIPYYECAPWTVCYDTVVNSRKISYSPTNELRIILYPGTALLASTGGTVQQLYELVDLHSTQPWIHG